MKTNYTREELIELCDRGIVSEDNWRNRDSAGSMEKLGACRALLKAGCEFQVSTEENSSDDLTVTDEDTIWLSVTYHGFNAFESGGSELDVEVFFIPTEKRLEEVKGEDWR